MPREQGQTSRERLIREALGRKAHPTEHYARAARCSLGEAAVVLLRLERDGVAEHGRPCREGMTWRLAA